MSPKGAAIWPHLDTPDTKFDKDGVYRTKLRTTVEDGQPLIDKIEAGITEHLAAVKKAFADDEKNRGKKFENSKLAKLADKPYTIGEGDDEGFVDFNFKMKASGKKQDSEERWTRTLALFDAKGAPLMKGTKVGGGSTIKVAYTLNPFSTAAIGTGMSLRLESVQVLDLKEYSRDAKSFGFESEDGFDSVGDAALSGAEGDEVGTEQVVINNGAGAGKPSGADF